MEMFRAHSIKTDWHPIPEIGDWPLDHAFVSTAAGMTWKCFGRGLDEEPNAPVIAMSEGEVLWAQAIAGEDGHAGIIFTVNGICHQCANRILIPAGVDVRFSPGNEIAIPLFSHYGLGYRALIERVRNAAAAANNQRPSSVTEQMLENAVKRIHHQLDSELEILDQDIQRLFNARVGDLEPEVLENVIGAYRALYDRREGYYELLEKQKLTVQEYQQKMRDSLIICLREVKDYVGEERFKRVFPFPIELAAAYIFDQPEILMVQLEQIRAKQSRKS